MTLNNPITKNIICMTAYQTIINLFFPNFIFINHINFNVLILECFRFRLQHFSSIIHQNYQLHIIYLKTSHNSRRFRQFLKVIFNLALRHTLCFIMFHQLVNHSFWIWTQIQRLHVDINLILWSFGIILVEGNHNSLKRIRTVHNLHG